MKVKGRSRESEKEEGKESAAMENGPQKGWGSASWPFLVVCTDVRRGSEAKQDGVRGRG